MVVVVNGAKGRSSRLLRRGLLVAAMACAGWLLFAASASAEELAGDDTGYQTPNSGGLLGGLLGGVADTLAGLTDTVTNLTGTVLDTTTSLLAPVLTPPEPPAETLPAPDDDTTGPGGPGTPVTDPVDAAPVGATAPVVAPAPPVAPPPAPVVDVVTPHSAVAPKAVAVVAPPAPVAKDTSDNAAADTHRGDSDPEPVKAPTAPSGPGSTASSAHDSFGGARGAHSVLTAQATLHPADAGFTSRSRAVNAAGRAAGLPACSPD